VAWRRRRTTGLATPVLAAALLAGTACLSVLAAVPSGGATPIPAGTLIEAGSPATLTLSAATVSQPLSTPEGPGVVVPEAGPTTAAGTSGEGIVWLSMEAPGTSWASATQTAVTVDVRVDAGPTQQVVLFDGSNPFTYAGFLGPLTVGPHTLSVALDPTLSHTTAGASVRLLHAAVGVLLASDPDYDQIAHAPVLYGRTSSGQAYTPLLTSSADTAAAAGSHQLAYVLVISAHDQGDSIVPAYQWGLWGRMTDIINILNETVSASGVVSGATYASCGCESLPYPDGLEAPEETTAPVQSTPFFTHPVLRDASATNYLSDKGTSPYRFEQLPVAAPPAGQLRDAVMDEHPWSYQISNEELPREHIISTDPDSLLEGLYPGYAVVQSNLSVTGTVSVEFEIRLAGSSLWYSTDYEQSTLGLPSTFPFTNGGFTRSAVKLPLGWQTHAISGFRIRLETAPGASSPPTLVIHSLSLLAVTPLWTVATVPLPPIGITSSTALVPVGLPG
jgi:hypothetical protein